jgi:hypothetical protein
MRILGLRHRTDGLVEMEYFAQFQQESADDLFHQLPYAVRTSEKARCSVRRSAPNGVLEQPQGRADTGNWLSSTGTALDRTRYSQQTWQTETKGVNAVTPLLRIEHLVQ